MGMECGVVDGYEVCGHGVGWWYGYEVCGYGYGVVVWGVGMRCGGMRCGGMGMRCVGVGYGGMGMRCVGMGYGVVVWGVGMGCQLALEAVLFSEAPRTRKSFVAYLH